MKDTQRTEYDVIVIGGGATGAGTARDCALRGLRTILVERLDFTAGATGRNHGLLHSGARYAHTDPESAAECIKENIILKRIARHCVEDTGGLFVTLPEDSLDYQREFVADCGKAGIHVDELSPEEAVHLEPAVNPNLIGAVRVPDGSIDPFRLTTANVLDARLHGADILTYHEVIGFLREGDRITGVRLRSHRDGTETELRDTMLADTGLMGSIATRMAPLVNGTLRLKPVKYLIDKCLGIDDRRTFPKYSSGTFESRYKDIAGEQEAFKRHVSYFHGCYVKNLKRNFLSEVIGTFVLILVILFLAERGNTSEVGLGSIGALPVAFLVVVIGMALGGTTGYAINPARDLDPRLAHQVLHIKGKGSSRWEYAWVPILGPILGAGFAVLVFWCYRMMCA